MRRSLSRLLCWAVRLHSAAVLINLFYKMLILYLALKTRSFNCSTPSPYFSVHLSKFFFLVIICHPQGPCVHILDTWGSEFRKCTICTSVKRQVILLFFYQILKVSDHLFRLISLPDVYLGINYDFHSFNSQILVLLIHIINIQGVLETIETFLWSALNRNFPKAPPQLIQSNMNITIQIAYCAVWNYLWPTRQLFNIQMAELLYRYPHTDFSHGQSGSPPYLMSHTAWKTPQQEEEHTGTEIIGHTEEDPSGQSFKGSALKESIRSALAHKYPNKVSGA